MYFQGAKIQLISGTAKKQFPQRQKEGAICAPFQDIPKSLEFEGEGVCFVEGRPHQSQISNLS